MPAVAGVTILTVGECDSTADSLSVTIAPLAYPADWVFYIACTSQTWTAVMGRYHVRTNMAFSDRKKHITMLNAAMFSLRPGDKGFEAPADVILRHELGHFVCGTEMEGPAIRYSASGKCL
jgi:hypothetical protein